MSSHRLAEARSLAYHRVIAARLPSEPAILMRASAKVAAWTHEAPMSRAYVDAWRAMLEGPIETLVSLLVEDSEHARAMRQTTPFAGALDARERWQIFATTRESAR